VFDAIEYNAMYARALNFNHRAAEWARARGKPVVGNSDLHVLDQMGTTYTLVDAPPDRDAICEAIRQGRVELRTRPLAWTRAFSIVSRMLAGGAAGHVRKFRKAKEAPWSRATGRKS
jgi:predicted metal-dependent phosphoesterase TrpH